MAGKFVCCGILGYEGWADFTKKLQLDGVKLGQPRAVAVADFKGDGSPDLVVTQESGPPILLENMRREQESLDAGGFESAE